MAETVIPIRSVKQYFQEFAVNGIGRGAKPELVKEQLLDSFQKEIFAQVTMRYHDPQILARADEEVDPGVREGVHNILDNSLRKWRRLCDLFGQYKETRMVIEPMDLMTHMRNMLDDIGNAVEPEKEKEVVLLDE